jgi:hypothetical protein
LIGLHDRDFCAFNTKETLMKTFIATLALIAVASALAGSAVARNDNARSTRSGAESFIAGQDRPAHCGHTLSTDPDEAIRFYIRRDCLQHKE